MARSSLGPLGDPSVTEHCSIVKQMLTNRHRNDTHDIVVRSHSGSLKHYYGVWSILYMRATHMLSILFTNEKTLNTYESILPLYTESFVDSVSYFGCYSKSACDNRTRGNTLLVIPAH